VPVGHGKDINLERINRGMAWFYRAYAKELNGNDARWQSQPPQIRGNSPNVQ
jgi:endonuclease YncB( thermonuclease family)